MSKYIAFLRAINVTNRYVKMEKLRNIIRELGYTDVDTYIQSGNVIISTNNTNKEKIRDTIEKKLHDRLGFEVPTFIRSIPQLGRLLDHISTIDDKIATTTYISFLHHPPRDEIIKNITDLSTERVSFSCYEAHVIWFYNRPKGKLSLTNSKLERILDQPATRRNQNTVEKIISKYS